MAFLIEPSNERIACMLNPESLTVRRSAGVLPRRLAGGALAGRGLSDDPVQFTGGGHTEIELSLLFDVDLAGGSRVVTDVRDLTGPLWRLAENAEPADRSYGRPPNVQLVWGKAWCVSVVITAVAERLESFGPDGVPRRSWLRLRLLRVPEPPLEPIEQVSSPVPPDLLEVLTPAGGEPEPEIAAHEVLGTSRTAGESTGTERLDELAQRYLGSASRWRWLAYLNDIVDPLRLAVGTVLRLPAGSKGPPAGTREEEP